MILSKNQFKDAYRSASRDRILDELYEMHQLYDGLKATYNETCEAKIDKLIKEGT